MRFAVRILVLIALPGLVFGWVVRAFGSGEPACESSDSGLLSLIGVPACASGDYGVLLAIGLVVAVAVIAAAVVRARPG